MRGAAADKSKIPASINDSRDPVNLDDAPLPCRPANHSGGPDRGAPSAHFMAEHFAEQSRKGLDLSPGIPLNASLIWSQVARLMQSEVQSSEPVHAGGVAETLAEVAPLGTPQEVS